MLDNYQHTGGIVIDLSKAFEPIPLVLLHKIKKLNKALS